MKGHVCGNIETFPIDKFHQLGQGKGQKLLIIGESPAPNGWLVSGKACYRPDGKILPTGKRLNELLQPFGVSVENCGFTELSKCFVSKRAELESCGKKCWPIFERQIKGKKYKLLIILGVQTTSILSKIIDRELTMGKIDTIKIGRRQYGVLPVYHPSPINPTGHAKNKLLFRKLGREIQNLIK